MKLEQAKCKPCEGGIPPMARKVALRYIKQVPGWRLSKNSISGEFKFKDFKQALGFVNKVGAIAEAEGHHPDISLYSWNKVRLELSTHAIGGLSQNDFILAAKVNRLLSK